VKCWQDSACRCAETNGLGNTDNRIIDRWQRREDIYETGWNKGLLDPSAPSRLWLVLEQANIVDEIARLPEQLDASVLERSRSLSGGKRQRLAPARAFLSRSQLIPVDEPTAHLDRANGYCTRAASAVRSWLPTNPPPSPTPTKSRFFSTVGSKQPAPTLNYYVCPSTANSSDSTPSNSGT
jgi:hypothetical protein